MTGLVADPLALFGAYPAVAGEVPDEAIGPTSTSILTRRRIRSRASLVLSSQKTRGTTRYTGYVGYRYAESVESVQRRRPVDRLQLLLLPRLPCDLAGRAGQHRHQR